MHSRGHVRATRLLVLFTNVFLVHPREMDSEASSRMVYLLEQETEIPMAMKHYLSDTFNKIRDDQMLEKLEALEKDDTGRWDNSAIIAARKSDVGNDGNESQEVNDMFDMLKASSR
eukprot:Plantae.Rhodophyta-Palmaria_palmata.ctg7853.p1 GENE.Plantae.Rhodophyta-Palmaria_palmata.ctg7853~~Plantae.Rhodophyta-Palmaria_palmata.ctg7853.p1  ORF type:complete len:116 (-),score=25.44 Plantae.Rhodophyta-Palmaria_palmata.ctg7853:590-937(-)